MTNDPDDLAVPATEAGRALLRSDFDTTGWGPRLVREHVHRAVLAIEDEMRALPPDPDDLATALEVVMQERGGPIEWPDQAAAIIAAWPKP